MRVYKLEEKVTEGTNLTAYARVATCGYHECRLEIDDTYYIDRYTNDAYMYYVHVKNGSLVKVCVYKESK